MIKLIILDVDGVLTDGKKYYNVDGISELKTFCDKDFTAIKRLRASGVNVCFLSGDSRINEQVSKNRNIDFYFSRGKNKVDFLSLLCEKYEVNVNEIVYVGDDLFDLDIMEKIAHPYCPNDSCKKIKNFCGSNVLKNNGGENVIAELVEVLLEKNLIKDSTIEEIMKLDEKEIF